MRGSPAGTLPNRPLQSRQPVDGHQHEDKVLLLVTLVIGAVVGLVVVAFILLTENLVSRLYPAGSAAWRRVLTPLAGALVTGCLLYRYFPNARGSGIPQTKTALFLRDGYIKFSTVLGKFGLCSVSLASGIALGREGPSVHVGAGIASTLGRKLGLSDAGIKALLPAGASAALAAAFNTPISAVLFTLEEVMGDMHAPVLGSIVLSSATSWMVLHLILGDEPLFHVPAYELVHPIEFVWYAALGWLGGLVSVAFVKLLLWQRKYFLRAPEATQWFLPGVGGLVVGLLALFTPDVLGVGYGVVGKALNGQLLMTTMALLVVLKVVATATCYASGNAGGIFGPSLFIGAMTGGAVGGVAHLLMPDYTGSAGAYALVGMGAAFAGIVRVPLTSVIMVFEITRDYSIIVPLMIANLISYFISSRLQEEPIYEALQHQDGLRLPSGAGAREALLMVGHGNRPVSQVLPASETVAQAAGSIDRTPGAYPVVDEHGFRGMVTLEQLDRAMCEGLGGESLESLVPEAPAIDDLIEGVFPHVYPDDPLDVAMTWLADGKIKVLPVLSRMNPRELKGTISLSDVLAAYAMARPGSGESLAETAPTRFPLRLLAGVLAALVGVAVLIASLNYFYRVERGKRAEQHFREANDLMQKERIPEAIEQYRDALSISHRIDHRLALGLALVKAERLDEASIYLSDVLRQQPGSGPANLGVAAIDAHQGRIGDAIIHYHRAIYGSWPSGPAANRFRTRLELLDLLKKSGRMAEARAELIALVADAPNDPSQQKQIGSLLLDFGMPREAADLYQGLLKRGPPDANEYDGLGEAEFALKDYKAAAHAFHSALEIDPGDPVAGRRAMACDQILSLDPTQRGVGARERFRRAEELLAAVLSQVAQCFGSEASIPASLQDDIKEARLFIASRRSPRSFSDAADAQMTLAEKLWTNIPTSCTKNAPDSLALVMSKLVSR